MWGQIDTSNDARARELRKCAKCGNGTLHVVHVTQHYSRGVPTGRSYQHRCGSCPATLESISVWRAIVELMFSATLTIGGLFMTLATIAAVIDLGIAGAFGNGGAIGRTVFGLVLLFGGLAWAGWTTWKAANLMINHPVVGTR
jgi:hypothetical protein